MKTKSRVIVILIVLILAALACNLPGGSSSSGQLPDGLTENYSPPSGAALSGAFNYSSEQEAVIQKHGSPTRFLILFGETARQETWIYDASGYTVVFRDGVKVSEKTEEAVYKEGMYATTYSPNLFYRGMTVDEIVLSTGKNKFMLTSVPELEQVQLMDMEGLTVGLVNGKISYMETIPALTETQLTANDFFSLTPEEAANQGKHTYMASFTIEGETYQDDYGELEFVFEGSGMQMGVEGYYLPFERIGQNQYYSETEGGITLTITLAGFNMVYVSDGQLVTLTRTDAAALQPTSGQDTPASSRTPEELANEGAHFYTSEIWVDGVSVVEDFGTIEFDFLEEEVLFTMDGETLLFNYFDENNYYSDVDGGISITFNLDGIVIFMHSDNTGVILNRQD